MDVQFLYMRKVLDFQRLWLMAMVSQRELARSATVSVKAIIPSFITSDLRESNLLLSHQCRGFADKTVWGNVF